MEFQIEIIVKKNKVNSLIDDIYKCGSFIVKNCYETVALFDRYAKLSFICSTSKRDLLVVFFAEQSYFFKKIINKFKLKKLEFATNDEHFFLKRNNRIDAKRLNLKYKLSYEKLDGNI